ncbi:hypothetical protein JL722_6542 [Aureococcus anophagefferens]|nr:hypothetical protein JL722_6542 [Aureococcus anophagefferens]
MRPRAATTSGDDAYHAHRSGWHNLCRVDRSNSTPMMHFDGQGGPATPPRPLRFRKSAAVPPRVAEYEDAATAPPRSAAAQARPSSPRRDGDDAPAPAPTPPDAGPEPVPKSPSADEPASPKARAVDDLPRREDSLANLASLERQPVKIVVSVHRARQLFNVGAPAKDMNPYCIVSYAGFEIKSRHEPATADPVWNLDAMLDVLVPFRSDDDSVVRLYFFSARTVFADRMLGKRGPASPSVPSVARPRAALAEEEGQREHRCVDDHVGNQQVNE